MSDPSQANRVASLNRKLEAAFSRLYHDYDCVQVCTIYWEDSDNEEFKTEAEEFQKFVEEELEYPVQIVTIPTEWSQRRLDEAVNSLLAKLQGESNLLVIHYGGHGDPNDDKKKNQERKSVWAACQQGGPTVDWYTIQAKFQSDNANVLLLLDCCYAAQAARNPERLVPHKVELLAAAGMGTKTAPPGPGSFTTACLREMKYLISEYGYVSISDLNTRLTKKEAKLSVTPFHVFIKSGYGDRSIRLYPKGQGSSKVVAVRFPQAALRVVVFLNDKSFPSIPEFVKQLVEDLHPDIAGLFIDDKSKEIGVLTNTPNSDFMTSMAVAIDRIKCLLGKLDTGPEVVKKTNDSNETLSVIEPLKWLTEFGKIEEVARSFQAEQLRFLDRSGSITREKCSCIADEHLTTKKDTGEDKGETQDEENEEKEGDGDTDVNGLSMHLTTMSIEKQKVLRGIWYNRNNDIDLESSESASSDYTRTSSDYTIKPVCTGTSSNPTRTPSLTYSGSEYGDKGEGDYVSRMLAGITLTSEVLQGQNGEIYDTEDDCLKK